MVIRVDEIGWRAARAVDAARSAPVVVASLSRSLYLDVDGDLCWLGLSGSTPHGRAILVSAVPPAGAGTRLGASLDVRGARVWRAPAMPWSVDPPARLAAYGDLAAMLTRVGEPDGFGALLAGRRPAFPLDGATADALSFLSACGADDAATAAVVGARLLGLGPGLTPAGDDLVGAAIFTRRWLAGAGSAGDWVEAAGRLQALAPERTNRISAVLLGDLLDGDGYAPLHDLARALAGGSAPDVVLDAAARLTRIGHSSGWDMLAGFVGALGLLPR